MPHYQNFYNFRQIKSMFQARFLLSTVGSHREKKPSVSRYLDYSCERCAAKTMKLVGILFLATCTTALIFAGFPACGVFELEGMGCGSASEGTSLLQNVPSESVPWWILGACRVKQLPISSSSPLPSL